MAVETTLLHNIRSQPAALRAVLDYQLGAGRVDLDRAARLVRERGELVIVGIGASQCASLPAAHVLSGAGIRAHVVDAAEMLHFEHDFFRPDAAYLLVSRSGETVEIVQLFDVLRRRGATILGLTNVPDSDLARRADVGLLLNCPADEMVAIQTYVATLLVLHLLALAVTEQLDAARLAQIEQVIAAQAAALPRWEAASHDWRPLLEGLAPIYLLARGPAYASALEGALLFHEVSKQPAAGLSAGYFRHGQAEVIDEHFRALVFAPDDGTRPLNLGLARDILRFGGQVRVIGPAGEDTGDLPLWAVETASPSLLPILDIVPVQLAAYRLAEWKGWRPGQFRIVGLVTRSEVSLKPQE